MKEAPRELIRFALILMILVLPGIASASWWNGDWQFRKRLTIDAAVLTAAGSAGLSEVTLPIRLHTGNFGYFNDVDKTGTDLRFIAAWC
jgi:biopolymer transport protein ExbB